MRAPSLYVVQLAAEARRLTHLLVCMVVWITGHAADAVLDFRTLIPGVLNVPVYRADGTNRPSAETGCFVELFAGTDAPIFLGARLFGTGAGAGYVWSMDPIPVIVPGAKAGDRISVYMRAFEPHWGVFLPEHPPPPRFFAFSETFSLIVSNTPTPLVGLRSFQFMPATLHISNQGGEAVLRWSAGDGTVYYDVEAAPALGEPGAWRSLGRTPTLEFRSGGFGSQWQADWVLTNSMADNVMFYRVRLLNP